MRNIRTRRESKQYIPPRLIHQLREARTEINKIYQNYNLQPKYEVPEIDLTEQQRQLSETKQTMLKIYMLNLQHAKKERARLEQLQVSTLIAEATIRSSQNEIDKIMNE